MECCLLRPREQSGSYTSRLGQRSTSDKFGLGNSLDRRHHHRLCCPETTHDRERATHNRASLLPPGLKLLRQDERVAFGGYPANLLILLRSYRTSFARITFL